ncbi:hypothetical protein IFM47457_04632 [Aspergillus lentulus]|nr:hypothetical protein IFM47457_04632 [Aspergillus lentulus]
MSENPDIPAVVRFQGRSGDFGWFQPPPKFFSPNVDAIFSMARVTIVGQDEGRPHEVNLDPGVGSFIMMQVPDKQPTLAGPTSSLNRMFKDTVYQLRITASGFNPTGEDVSVKVEIFGYHSTLASVTRDVLREAESEPSTNAIAFGISEATFAHLMTAPPATSVPERDVGTKPLFLKLKVNIDVSKDYPQWPFIHIDVDASELIVSGRLLLSFVRRQGSGDPVAEVRARVTVFCKPVMVTDTNDTLQIQFRRAELSEGSVSVNVFDDGPNGILGGYANLDEFNDAVNTYLSQVVSNKGQFGFALPVFFESRPMPDHWDHFSNMRLSFEHFRYRTVDLHGLPISYLFIVFSVRHLGLPPPCICDDTTVTSSLETDTSSADTSSANTDPVMVPFEPAALSLPQFTDYSKFLAVAQVSTLGISQRTFQEIAKPYANMGIDKSDSTGGDIYASTRVLVRAQLETAEFTSSGIKAVLDLVSEGTAKAGIRNKCGGTIASTSVKLNIAIDNTTITWRLRMFETRQPTGPPVLTIEAVPWVQMGKAHVSFDGGVFDLPPPWNQIDDWILTSALNAVGPVLSLAASHDPRIRLSTVVQNNGGIRWRFVDDRFFAGEAGVILGRLFEFLSWK